MVPKCPWDDRPVAKTGYTCDEWCYRSWIYWMQTAATDPRFLVLQPMEDAPLTAEEQPWYRPIVGNYD